MKTLRALLPVMPRGLAVSGPLQFSRVLTSAASTRAAYLFAQESVVLPIPQGRLLRTSSCFLLVSSSSPILVELLQRDTGFSLNSPVDP